MTTQTPATAEMEKWLRIRVVFSHIFDSGSGSERKTQNPVGVDSGKPDPVLPLVYIWRRTGCGIRYFLSFETEIWICSLLRHYLNFLC